MNIIDKSLYTFLDLAMDHFKTSVDVSERYLVWLFDFFDTPEHVSKKCSKVGKGIDYFTFKNWVAKENRFVISKTNWPKRNFTIRPHYHSAESVLEFIQENDYEDQLKFYEALVLLSLVDRKYILGRIDFLDWTAKCLRLDSRDCSIIRDHVIEEFNLSFDLQNLKLNEREDIYFCGINMAHLSGDIIDKSEAEFLSNLRDKLSLGVTSESDQYFYFYYFKKFSSNKFHSSLRMHQVGAVLLRLIGSDSLIDKKESLWFRTQMGELDNNLLSSLLSSDMTKLIDGLSASDKILCYLLGLEVSLLDNKVHKNEQYWLDYIYESVVDGFVMDSDLTLVLFEVLNRHLDLVSENWSLFSRVLPNINPDAKSLCFRWKYLNEIEQRSCDFEKISLLVFNEQIVEDSGSKRQNFIELSKALGSDLPLGNLSLKLHDFVRELTVSNVEGVYGEMLICEILKISLIDKHIESIEEDFLRELQDRFLMSDSQIHRVMFITSFLIGQSVDLSPRVRYNFI